MTIQGDLFMGKTNLKIEYVLKAANNIGFDNIDTYIPKLYLNIIIRYQHIH